jgi:hypothetical protein
MVRNLLNLQRLMLIAALIAVVLATVPSFAGPPTP